MRGDYQNAINNNFNVQDTQGVKINVEDPKERLSENYTNKDFSWQTGAHSGDIYISTPDSTHNMIVNHHNHKNDVDYDRKYQLPENGYPGTSGFFTNEDTASRSFKANGKFDSVQLGHDLQQAPHYDKDRAMECMNCGKTYFPEYNRNLDCFRVNEEKMLANYGTTDFYAAQAKCLENTAWGEGGGHQGYNPYINQMINNGSLEYIPEKSRTCDSNKCFDYAERKAQAIQEASFTNDHIEKTDIQGGSNQRIGYNEISRSANMEEGNGKDAYLNQKDSRGLVTTTDIPPPANPKQNGNSEPVGAKKDDLTEIEPKKTADQPSVGPQNPSQITPVEDSTILKNLSGNKESGISPENEAVSAATKAAGGMQNG